jgi:hypothetical protein
MSPRGKLFARYREPADFHPQSLIFVHPKLEILVLLTIPDVLD